MSSNEEYLDSLLKTMLEEETPKKELSPSEDGVDSFSGDDLAAMLDELGADEEENPAQNNSEQDAAEEPFAIEDAAEESFAIEEAPEAEMQEELHAAVEADDPNRQMSAEEIEAMFAAMDAENSVGQAGAPDDTEGEGLPDDMLALLESVSGDEAVGEESGQAGSGADGDAFDFFAMNDEEPMPEDEAPEEERENVIGADLEALTEQALEIENGEEQIVPVKDAEAAEAGAAEEKTEDAARAPKKKKSVKVKREKKPGLFGRLFALLTDDGEDEAEQPDSIDGYNMDAENQAVLKQLGETKLKQPGARKEKTKKEKKPKKEKPSKEEKGKKPKKEKPKKEPKPKAVQAPQKKGKPLPKKKVAAIVALGATLVAASWLFGIFVPQIMDRNRAMRAYEKGNYEETFYLLQDKELKAAEKETYKKAILVLQMQREMEAYENYSNMDMPLEALNALVKGVSKYQKGEEAAQQYGIVDKTKSIYLDILTILQEEYGLTEADVDDILSQKDDVYYTVALKRALGEEIMTPQSAGEDGEEEPADDMPDMLSEEKLLEQELQGGAGL